MKKKIFSFDSFLLVAINIPFTTNAQNPIIQTIYATDQVPMVYTVGKHNRVKSKISKEYTIYSSFSKRVMVI